MEYVQGPSLFSFFFFYYLLLKEITTLKRLQSEIYIFRFS